MKNPKTVDITKLAKDIPEADQKDVLEKAEERQEEAVQKVVSEQNLDYTDRKKGLELEDIYNRLKTRRWVAIVLFVLLFMQNLAVFGLFVYVLLVTGIPAEKIDMFKVILPIVIPATLGETAYAIKIIVEWLYKEVSY